MAAFPASAFATARSFADTAFQARMNVPEYDGTWLMR